jgi:hypothetical protein
MVGAHIAPLIANRRIPIAWNRKQILCAEPHWQNHHGTHRVTRPATFGFAGWPKI